MLPSIIYTVLPIPSLLLLLLLTLYHLTPLLTLPLFSHKSLSPSLQRLASIIPHPRQKNKNLPREFFNLPPRPGSPGSPGKRGSAVKRWKGEIGVRLGLRGKVVLMLIAQAGLSLACGWAALGSGVVRAPSKSTINWALVAASVVVLPSSVAMLAIYTLFPPQHRNTYESRRYFPRGRLAFPIRTLKGEGGVTHSTLYPRILPLSTALSGAGIVLAAAVPGYGKWVILAHLGLSMAILGGCTALYTLNKEGRIRLVDTGNGTGRSSSGGMREKRSSACESASEMQEQLDDEEMRRRMIADGSWVSSPSRPPTPVSSFTYSPSAASTTSASASASASFKTPKSKPSSSTLTLSSKGTAHEAQLDHSAQHLSPKTPDSAYGYGSLNDSSFLTEPTNTPTTMSEWSFPSPTSPEVAHTRPRSPHSPSRMSPTSPNLPRPNTARLQVQGKASDSTTYTHTLSTPGTPGSAIRSPDGSILAGYSPDPFHPLPRNFESLTSYPLSPSQLESRASLVQVASTNMGRSSTSLTCIPVERVGPKGSSTWTLQTYHSPLCRVGEYETPQNKRSSTAEAAAPATEERRAPPPPPMPVDMPLPPTPTAARSSTLWECSSGQGAGKESMELLMSGMSGDRDWVEVDGAEGWEEWGKGGKGVGVVGVVGTAVCFGLTMPLLVNGLSTLTSTLYLISLLLPSPLIALTSYLLRYQPRSTSSQAQNRSAKSSNTTAYRSLALVSASQLSLPISISPKLTPPAPKRASTTHLASPGTKLSKLLEPKPSLTTFVGPPKRPRRHTVYGGGLSLADLEADERMRKTLFRRSGDVWIESGHAIEGGSLFSRATEMLKPVPAMRVLAAPSASGEGREMTEGLVKRLRGGVVSMLSKRASGMFGTGFELDTISRDMRATEEGGLYDDAPSESSYASATSSPARSAIAISITHPSPIKRASYTTSIANSRHGNVDRGRGRSSSAGSEVDMGVTQDSLPTAEIREAKRGRMSNGPTYIFGAAPATALGAGATRNGEEGYELDWLTAGVLPGLVPSIRIGSDIRVEPAPNSAAPASSQSFDQVGSGETTPKARSRPLSDISRTVTSREEAANADTDADESFSSLPSFRPAKENQSTPHQNRSNNSKYGPGHGHTRSFSSSVEFSRSPEYYTAETATSASRVLRHRHQKSASLTQAHYEVEEANSSSNTIKHKASFGLPRLQAEAEEFESSVRRSFDDLSAAAEDYNSALQSQQPSSQWTTAAGREGGQNHTGGIDLPPFPFTLTHKPSLSRVSERTELPSDQSSEGHTTRPMPSADNTEANASFVLSRSVREDMELAFQLGATPKSVHSLSHRTPARAASQTQHLPLPPTNTLPGDNDADADAGDDYPQTPKSSFASGEISFAPSANEDVVEEMERMMAMDTPTRAEFVISPPSSSYDGEGRESRASDRSSTLSTGYTAASSSFAGNGSILSIHATGTGSGSGYEAPPPPVPLIPESYRPISHPHPPPLTRPTTYTSSTALEAMQGYTVSEPHPPLQKLLPRKSTETIRSDYTSASATTSATDESPMRVEEAFRPSKEELKRISLLKERNGSRTNPFVLKKQRSAGVIGQTQNQIENAKRGKGETDKATKKGLQPAPLQIITDRSTNTNTSTNTNVGGGPKSAPPGNEGIDKSFAVLQQQQDGLPVPRSLKGGSPTKGKGKGSSRGSGKENARVNKASTGSGVDVGRSGLRA